MTKERWAAIPGHEGGYEVSDQGRIRSGEGRILSTGPDSSGYPQVSLRVGSKKITRRVHRLVAEAFIPNPDNLPLVRHWDDVKTNNHVENLLWGTQSDNVLDLVRNGGHHLAKKTHCLRGHPLTNDNVYVYKTSRQCRTCARDRWRLKHGTPESEWRKTS